MSLQSKVTRQLGGFGTYQRRLSIVLCFVAGVMATFRMVTLFVAYVPPHRCWIDELGGLNEVFDVPDGSSNVSANSTVDRILAHIPLEHTTLGQYQWSQCSHRIPATNTTTNGTISPTGPCNDGWSYLVRPNVVTAVTEFDLVCEKAWIVPLIPSMLLVGLMLSPLVGGYLSDKYGRKATLLLCFVLMLAGSLGMAWTPAVVGVHIGMMLAGMPTIMSTTSSIIFIRESTPRKIGKKISLVLMVCTSVGNLLTPAFAYFIPNWRWMLTVMAIVALSLLPFVIFLAQESVVWLLQTDGERAKKVMRNIGKVNRIDAESLEIFHSKASELMQDLRGDEEKDPSETSTGEQNVADADAKSPVEQLTFKHLFTIPFLRKRLVAVTLALFTISIVYFGLSLNANRLAGDIYLNCFLSALVDIPADIFGSFLVVRLGCRRVYVLCTLTCGVFLLATPLFKMVHDIGETICSMTAKFFVGGSFLVVHLFTGDFFPTVLRNQAYGASSFVARTGGIIVPYILYLGDVAHFSVPYLTMGASCLLAAVSVYTLPETKNLELPVTLDDARELEGYLPKLRCGSLCKSETIDASTPDANSAN